MDKSDTIIELAKALAKAQGQIKPAVKDSENPHFRSKYADLSSVWEACRKPLTDNGLSVVQMPVDAPTPGSVALTTLLLHISGEFISSTVSAPLTKQDAQGIGSALTYLRRYALSAIIGVVADDDDDGNAASRSHTNGASSYSAPREQFNGSAPGKASEKQIKMLFAIWNKAGYEGDLKEWIATTFGCGLNDLSVKQASEAIETLQPEKASANV
jgi:hypothetical protein